MRRALAGLALLASLLSSGQPAAEDLNLEGALVQGGLVQGRTVPGTRVTLDGRAVRVAPDGHYLLGFGRDAPAEAVLELTAPDGTQIRHSLAIRQRDYDIQRIDGLPPKKVTPPAEVLARIQKEVEMVAAVRRVDRAQTWFEAGFRWPLTGPITGVFGSQRVLNGEPRRPHFGVDIAAPAGTPVTAPAPGLVVLAHRDMYFSGGTLILDHGHGLTSAYLHMQEVLVEEGTLVAPGQIIGTVGASGRSSGAHLDWRFNWFDQRLDPELIAGPMPETP